MQFSALAEHTGRRLDLVLHEQFPAISRSRLQDWIKRGRVLVNGAPARASRTLREGDRIEVEPGDLPPLRAEPEAIPLRVLYEDQDLVAIDKPAGMVVHAGAGVHTGTLVNALLARFRSLSALGGDLRPGIVHRLDRFTSGVLLVAKNDARTAHSPRISPAARSKRRTWRWSHGAVKADTGRIEKPIARDPRHRTRMTARLDRGRAAWIRIPRAAPLRRASRCSKCASAPAARTRSACTFPASAIPWPATGFMARPPPNPACRAGRFFLHAHRIRFQQPSTGQSRRNRVAPPRRSGSAGWNGYN